MRYMPAVATDAPESLDGFQPGQWINYQGTRGRFYSRNRIAWGGSATKRFDRFAAAVR